MTRDRKAGVSTSETIEQQIEIAQDKVVKIKAAHENAVNALQMLMDKRDHVRLYLGENLIMYKLHKNQVFRRKKAGS